MNTFELIRETHDPEYNELLMSFWILFATFMLIVIMFAFVSYYYKIVYRQSKYIYCEQLLKQSEKITDQEDIEYLKSILPKLESYQKKWWYNNSFSFMSRVSKMNKIAKKYNLEVEIWNK